MKEFLSVLVVEPTIDQGPPSLSAPCVPLLSLSSRTPLSLSPFLFGFDGAHVSVLCIRLLFFSFTHLLCSAGHLPSHSCCLIFHISPLSLFLVLAGVILPPFFSLPPSLVSRASKLSTRKSLFLFPLQSTLSLVRLFVLLVPTSIGILSLITCKHAHVYVRTYIHHVWYGSLTIVSGTPHLSSFPFPSPPPSLYT